MNHSQTRLENYSSADETQRLSLFLSHRDLRNDFMQIEQIEVARRINQRKAAFTDARKRQKNRFLRNCWQWLRV